MGGSDVWWGSLTFTGSAASPFLPSLLGFLSPFPLFLEHHDLGFRQTDGLFCFV